MCRWDAVKELGAFLGQGIDDGLVEKLSSGPDSGKSLDVICRSLGVLAEAYPPDIADLISNAIFETDFSRLPAGDREEALAKDVFCRISGLIAGEGAYDTAFKEFEVSFRRAIRWFKSALAAVMSARGLKKEEISLDSPGIKRYLSELRDLPCRRLGELSFAHRMPGGTAMARTIESLLKKYEGKAIPGEYCRSIMEVMGRISSFPGYYRTMDARQKLAEARPVLLAISGLQMEPGKEPAKASLLSALGILLFNVFPSAKLLKLVRRLKPDPADDGLSYEYFAILAMSHMLAGQLDEAAFYNGKALEHAMDEEKRAYAHILESCIRLYRRDFEAAISALYRCSSMARDKRMRAVAQFYLGIIYYEAGSIAAARECFERSCGGLDDELDSMNVYNNIGACAMVQGDLTAAIKAFERVEHLSKYMSSNTAKLLKSVAFGNLGIIYFNMASYDLAVGYFTEALKLDRDIHNKKGMADQLGNIGLALKLKEEYKLALEYFRSSLNISFAGDYAEGALFSLSQIEQLLAMEGRYGEAERLKRDIIRQNPDIARMLYGNT